MKLAKETESLLEHNNNASNNKSSFCFSRSFIVLTITSLLALVILYYSPYFINNINNNNNNNNLRSDTMIVNEVVQEIPQPLYKWTFNDLNTEDDIPQMRLTLYGDASINGGVLTCDGTGDYAGTTNYGPTPINSRTLSVWVKVPDLTESGGGAISIDCCYDAKNNYFGPGHFFNSIVFGEKSAGKWMSGSDNWRRTNTGVDKDKEPETVTNDFVNIVIVYRNDNSISIYRNGVAYGSTFTKGVLKEFPVDYDNGYRVLFCQRHGSDSGKEENFNGKFEITEGSIFNTALTSAQVGLLYNNGYQSGPEPVYRWLFNDKYDTTNNPNLEIVTFNNAIIKNGYLQCDGIGDWAYTKHNAPETLGVKTLSVWVRIPDLNQQGGGAAISIDSNYDNNGDIYVHNNFDAITYNGRFRRQWSIGSNQNTRTRDLRAPQERNDNDAINLITVYAEDGGITMYRNGELYGTPYNPRTGLVSYQGEVNVGGYRVLFCRRHCACGKNVCDKGCTVDGGLNGHFQIFQASVYNVALTAKEAKEVFETGML